MAYRPNVDPESLADFCRRWKVAELALFGSALRDDFGPESDVDLLVRFEPEAQIGLLEHVAMEHELSDLLGRKADLVSRRAIERSHNPIRRQAILSSAEPIYAEG